MVELEFEARSVLFQTSLLPLWTPKEAPAPAPPPYSLKPLEV